MAVEPTDVATLRAASASIMMDRYRFANIAGLSFEGKRDFYATFGYPKILSYADYRAMYLRGGIAKRVVEVLPKATWRGGTEIVEDENPDISTALEQAFLDLDERFNLWSKFQQVDILAGLSSFAVLLIGAPGDLSTELPKGKAESLLYFTAFSGGGDRRYSGMSSTHGLGADAAIQSFELDFSSQRFGLPLFYQLRRMDLSSPELQQPVHWSRIIHIAEGCLEDAIFGQPTLENVYNLILDLDKVTGGGAEAFWLRAHQGFNLNVDADAMLSEPEKTALKEQADEYQHELRRWMFTRKAEVKMLGSDVANFAAPADAIISQIAGSKGIPKRILQGSEQAELASSQDRENFLDVVNGRRSSHAGPYIVRPLVDRLIQYGYLPTPAKGLGKYEVKWPHVQTMTEAERADGAAKWAQINSTNANIVFSESEIRSHWYDMEPLEDDPIQYLSEKEKADGALQWANTNKTQGATIYTDEEIRMHWSGLEPLKPEQKTPVTAPERVTSTAPTAPDDLVLGQKPIVAAPATKKVLPFKAASDYKLSSTQVNLPTDLAQYILDFSAAIPDDSLAADGRETEIYCTLKYGIHTNDADLVRSILIDQGSISLALSETGYFTASDYDVLYIGVISDDLHLLNARISQLLEVTDTHPTYQPHVTIAYLKSGLAEKYAKNDLFAGRSAVIDTVVFSPAEGESTDIALRTAGGPGSGWTAEGGHVPGGSKGDYLLSHKEAYHEIAIGNHATIAHEDLRKLLLHAEKKGTADLSKLTLEGTPIFAGGLNKNRSEMPQISKEAQPGFLASLKEQGIGVKHENVSPHTLVASQNEINAARVGQKLREFESGKKDLRPILVSKDNKVLDGHHRWAVGVALRVDNPATKIPVIRIGVNHTKALATMHDYAKKHGLVAKALTGWTADGEYVYENEMIAVLQAAIEVGNTEVIDKIIGIDRMVAS